jgi:hypothetical protein
MARTLRSSITGKLYCFLNINDYPPVGNGPRYPLQVAEAQKPISTQICIVLTAPVYGCDAFWNTFWNLNQLWSPVNPDIAEKWVNSLLEIYDRGDWLS